MISAKAGITIAITLPDSEGILIAGRICGNGTPVYYDTRFFLVSMIYASRNSTWQQSRGQTKKFSSLELRPKITVHIQAKVAARASDECPNPFSN